MITELRMYLAERLLRLVLWVAPIEHKDGRKLVKMIRDYADEILQEAFQSQRGYFKWDKEKPIWIPCVNGPFTIHPQGMVTQEGEGTVLIKGFDPIEQLLKNNNYYNEK